MAVAGTTSLGSLIKPIVDPDLIPSVFQNAHFLRNFRSDPRGPHAGTTVKKNAIVSQNTGVAACAEAGSFEAVGAAGYQQGSFAFTTIYGTFGYYDEAKRALGLGLSNSYHAEDTEAVDTLAAVRDLMETTMMADAATGLLGMVDDDSTAWGGVNRGTYTTLKSLVVAGGSAAVTEAMLNNAVLGLGSAPYGARPEVIMSEFIQMRSYSERIVASPALNQNLVGDTTYEKFSFANIPWIPIPDFVTSEIAFLSGVRDGSGIMVYDHNIWDVNVFNDGDVVDFMPVQLGPDCRATVGLIKVAKTAPSSTYAWSMSLALVVKRPMHQAKIEALATSW